jgi:hypothetical protein
MKLFFSKIYFDNIILINILFVLIKEDFMNDTLISVLGFIIALVFSAIFGLLLGYFFRWITLKRARSVKATEKELRGSYKNAGSSLPILFLLFTGFGGAIVYWLKFRPEVRNEIKKIMEERGMSTADLT